MRRDRARCVPSSFRASSWQLAALAGLCLFGQSCETDGKANAAPKKSGQREPGGKSQRPKVPVAVVSVQTGDIQSDYESSATLQAQKSAQVLARVTGVVRSISVEEGKDVKAGAVLLRIENDEFRLRLKQATAKAEGLRDRFERLGKMVKQKFVSSEEFEALRHELSSAEAEAGLAQLQLSRTRVKAPFSGRVVRRLVDVGQTVQNSAPLFEIADMQPLLARVFIPSKELGLVAPGQTVSLTLDSNGAKLEGTIELVSPLIDPNTGTIKVTVKISEYPKATRVGDFAKVRIVTAKRTDVLVIPSIAIVEERGEKAVFVVENGLAQRRVVDLGFRQGARSQARKGLKVGERLVVKGQQSLKDGDPVEVVKAP